MFSKKPNEGLLARVNFPLFTVQMLTSRHVLVAGGGGSAKTGVANGFEVFELHHNGQQFSAEECLRHITGGSVVMNCSTLCTSRNTYLVAGQESHCQLYTVNFRVVSGENSFDREDTSNDNKEVEVRKRKKRNSDSASGFKEHNSSKDIPLDSGKVLELAIEPLKSVQTDFSDGESLQRVVRISHIGNLMATGGTDGYLRLWTFPDLNSLHNIPAHSKEIDDLDFSSDEKLIASVAKDGRAVVWNVSTGKKAKELQWVFPNGTKYLCKRCRFGVVEDKKEIIRLFILTNPVGKGPSFIQQWDALSGELTKSAGLSESGSALAVRNDGRFVAVGTMFSGSVHIFVAFSLQQVLLVRHVHDMFVTGLEFLPVQQDSSSSVSPVEAAVLSISVDNKVCIHSLPFRRSLPLWVFLLMMVIVLFSSFFLCCFFGL
ncbi:unnamed protein product [Bemisia tabaci]|uniref:Prolactin regulatory element-binding protein n=1 Tax=Bemisia tabaci TaxID=7038 RepID=A0A9P0F8Y9_BEMTA|nr:unnamed protein product [Bemisia tabaci]